MPIKVPISTPGPHVVPTVVEGPNNAIQHNDETHLEEANPQRANEGESQEMPLRRSLRERRSAIANDYVFYL